MDRLATRDLATSALSRQASRVPSGGGRTMLTSLVTETELHVSDEDRDFVAGTHIGPEGARRDSRFSVRVDDENGSAEDSVELPALP